MLNLKDGAEMKSFSTPTIVSWRGVQYYVIGVDAMFNEGGAVRLQPIRGGNRVVISPSDAEWEELVIVEHPKTLSA